MANLGSGEILVVLLIALIVLGPERLPVAARKIGGFVRQVRQMSSGFQAEVRKAIDVDLHPGDEPFHPDESHIRPVPDLPGDASRTADDAGIDDLEADIRARAPEVDDITASGEGHDGGRAAG